MYQRGVETLCISRCINRKTSVGTVLPEPAMRGWSFSTLTPSLTTLGELAVRV